MSELSGSHDEGVGTGPRGPGGGVGRRHDQGAHRRVADGERSLEGHGACGGAQRVRAHRRLERHHVLDRRGQAEAALGELRPVRDGADQLVGVVGGVGDIQRAAAHAVGDAVDGVDDRVASGVEHDEAAVVVGRLGHDALDGAVDGGDVGALVGGQKPAGNGAGRAGGEQLAEARQGHDRLLGRRLCRSCEGRQGGPDEGREDDHQERRFWQAPRRGAGVRWRGSLGSGRAGR